jgi:AAA+ superfamily predicted ATPase
MLNKNYVFLVCCLFTSLFSLAMDPPMPPPIQRTYPLDFQPMRFQDDKSIDNDIDPHPIQAANNDPTTFEGMAVADLDFVLANAPRQVNMIIPHLKNPKLLGLPRYRYIIFEGPAGVGKTVLAKAIARKIGLFEKPWQYEYISSSAFAGKYRNQTGCSFRSYLKKIDAISQPTLIIIDQLNKIMEYPEDPAGDEWFASDLLCNFMDNLHGKEHLFLIGIMDRVTELSKRLKNRIRLKTVYFDEPTSPDLKRIIFTSKCINEFTQFHPDITNEWLVNYLAQAPTISGRNFRGLALQVAESFENGEESNDDDAITQIKKQHLETALTTYIAAKKDTQHVDPYEAHQDTLERLHQEKMQQQEELHQQRMLQLQEQYNAMALLQQQALQQQTHAHLPEQNEYIFGCNLL